MPWTECVIDASMHCPDGLFCFCPIEGNIDGEFSVVTGFNVLGSQPPKSMKLVAIVHEDGPDAVEAFYREHAEALAKIRVEV